MQVITVKVDAMREGEQAVADIQFQQKKGENWNITKVATLTSGTGEAERKLTIGDDERVIIEGRVTKKVVMDPDQNAAKVVDTDDEVRAAQEQLDLAQKRLNQIRQEKGRAVDPNLQDAAQFAPRTNLGNPVPQQSSSAVPHHPGVKPATPPPTPPSNPNTPSQVGGSGSGQGSTGSDESKSNSTSPASTPTTSATPGAATPTPSTTPGKTS